MRKSPANKKAVNTGKKAPTNGGRPVPAAALKHDPEYYVACFGLAMAGLMWMYSFLNPYHAEPLTTFYQEWGTALIGLAAMILLLGGAYWRTGELPRVVLLPVSLMLLAVVQYGLGKMPYFGQMLMFALYLMWMAMLIMLGARLRELLSLPTVATVLAACLVVGTELNAWFGIQQHFQWHLIPDWMVTRKMSEAVYGNIAQPNHFSDYLTLGLASLGLLYARGALRHWQTALLALPILFALQLSGSREVWVFLPWLAATAFLWQYKDRTQRPLLVFTVLALVGFALMLLVLKLPGMQGSGGSVNTVQRMFSKDVGSVHLRFHYLWPEAMHIFLKFPLLGAGFGEYAYQHYLMGPVMRDPSISNLYNNAHNLLFQIAAECGLVGLLILFGTLIPWLRQAWRAERSIYHWWGYSLLAVLGIHSMGEYPLWYAYFLGIAALTLGLLDGTRFKLELGMVGRVFVLLSLGLGAVSLQQLYAGYHYYEEATNARPTPQNYAAYVRMVDKSVRVMQQLPLLQPYAAMISASGLDSAPISVKEKLKTNSRVQRFIPTAPTCYREAYLLALNGEEKAAATEFERALWAYPLDANLQLGRLQALAAKNPEIFAPLLKSAMVQHKEYLSAVHSR